MVVEKGKACLTQSEIEKWLKEVGVNPTAQRIAICQHVLCDADHPTADEVKDWADKNFPKISLATVYNTLKTLVEAKILREFRFPHSEKTFYDNNIVDHFHLIDVANNKLIDVDPSVVKICDEKLNGFQVTKADIVLYGTHKINKKNKNEV